MSMRKLCACFGFMLSLLFAQAASAQSPCGGVCQAYYPCDYACDLCVGDPGLWEDGHCWGDMIQGTCGDIGQCGWQPCNPNWVYDQSGAYQGVIPQFEYDPCDWEVQWNPETSQWEWVEVCDYNNPYECTVYGVLRYVRHQDNCSPASSETFCLLNNNGSQQFVGRYPGPWESACCWDSNMWGCTTSYPQCPNF
jgi:hypothetical protein